MEHSKHTPGPWRRQVIAPNFDRIAIQTANGKHAIATVWVSKADARLIAAAPDMLETLQEAVNKGYMWDNDPELWAKASAAIAKAKGAN